MLEEANDDAATAEEETQALPSAIKTISTTKLFDWSFSNNFSHSKTNLETDVKTSSDLC